jgi:hypothetical protein
MSDISADKTVFISYRRNVASFIARAVFQDLRANGYDVFMDVESIDSGTFDTIILNQIAARAHFLVILTPGTLERCNEPGDWLRREIETAMDLGRNIVPIFVNNFTLKDTDSYLTGKLSELPRFNSLNLPHDYFDEGMAKLRARYLRQSITVVIQPTPTAERRQVAQKIEAVARQGLPTKADLSAEELRYFVQVVLQDVPDLCSQDVTLDVFRIIEHTPTYLDWYRSHGGSTINTRIGKLIKSLCGRENAERRNVKTEQCTLISSYQRFKPFPCD